MAELRNVCGGRFGGAYDFYIEREWLSRIVGRVVWGIDTGAFYASMRAIGDVVEGATILDVPCGGGVALRALQPGQRVRYIAVDLDAKMLERARRRARERGLDQVEFIEGDICELPLEDGVADLCVSYSGLHCVARPEVAVAELARCLRVGGELIGTTFLSTGTRRQRLILGAAEWRAQLGALGTREDLAVWLDRAGFAKVEIAPDRGFVLFRGRKPRETA